MRSINAFVVCVALLLAACAPHKSAPKAENFPVVVPFAIDRAGSKVTVEFELPDAIYPDIEEPIHRSVFIGLRRVEDKGGGEKELKEWMRRNDYLQRNPVRAKLKLERWERDQWLPAQLRELHENIGHGPSRVWSEPVSNDGVVQNLNPTDPDYMELKAIGQDQDDKAYATYQWAGIVPPTPGRYRLHVESLQEHSAIRGLTFELLVSHEFLRK